LKRPPRNDFERQIYEETERETRKSRFRDRISRQRVDPYQYDITMLINFLASRRLRQPGTRDIVLRIHRSVDTEALRLAIALVLEKGSYTPAMRRRCERIEGYCNAFESALTLLLELKDVLLTESSGETAMTQQSELDAALAKVLDEHGDPDATAEIVEKASSLPHDDTWISVAAALAGEVWRRKDALASARAEEANRRADALATMNRLPPSDITH